MNKFTLHSPYSPMGDQPQAIAKLTDGLKKNLKAQTLLGVTGSGKTFTMANVIEKIQKPTLIISHNKTLAAQLYSEFKEYFPNNAVHYFVSYYDYYQPEAYIPQTDTYIEKDTAINDEIDRLRHAATHSLLTRNDVIVVASVSCIYSLGNPIDYQSYVFTIRQNETVSLKNILKSLTSISYERNDYEFTRGRIRVKGDTIEVFPAYEDEYVVRIELFGNTVEKLSLIDSLTGNAVETISQFTFFPAKHFATPLSRMKKAFSQIRADLKTQIEKFKTEGRLLEAQRIEQRTNYDLEMIAETGMCKGIENYSRYFDGRKPGDPPFTLIDYFPKNDYSLFIDESHMTVPQIAGMYEGDKARKTTLVNFGFRLPSALDNRPLTFDEFMKRTGQITYVSATPAPYEINNSKQIVEQLIRPTGLLDPDIEIKKTEGQIDDVLDQIKETVKNGQRVLITTLTKKLAESLSEYLKEAGVKATFLHHEVDTLDRIDILRDLRKGVYDVIVGINLLREGLDLPEVSLVIILEADKEGFLRSERALIQTMGRAARHLQGKVIMYADSITGSMKRAIDETNRRRKIQEDYNKEHSITPESIQKEIRKDIVERMMEAEKPTIDFRKIPRDELRRLIKTFSSQMDLAAKNLEFEKAAKLRDQISELKELV